MQVWGRAMPRPNRVVKYPGGRGFVLSPFFVIFQLIIIIYYVYAPFKCYVLDSAHLDSNLYDSRHHACWIEV